LNKFILLFASILPYSAPAAEIQSKVTIATDYIYRGKSKTDLSPVVQGDLRFGIPWGLAYSLGASNIGADSNRGIELSTTFSQQQELSPLFTSTIAATFYHNPYASLADTWDFSGALTFKNLLRFAAHYAPKFFGTASAASYFTLEGTILLSERAHFYMIPSMGYNYFANEIQVGNRHYWDGRIELVRRLPTHHLGLFFVDTSRIVIDAYSYRKKAKDQSFGAFVTVF
jgi:uncharacterized protein (TIGR02001 family)